MDIQDFLRQKIQSCAIYLLTDSDQRRLAEEGVEKFIERALLSKKFRKWKVGEEYQAEIRQNIHFSVSKNLPIKLTFFFGGYKLWRFESSPEVDWAEFFAIAYYLSYAAPIAAAYQPGVVLQFWAAHPSIMSRQSNIPENDCQKYRQSLEKLLEQFRPYLPENIKAELHSFAELYPNDDEYTKELESLIAQVNEEYLTSWPEARKEKKARTSNLNIQWKGAENWEVLSEEEKNEKVRLGPVVHDGYCRLSRVNNAIKGKGRFNLTATPLPKGDSIPIGTTRPSVTKFWTGFGILSKKGDTYSDRILSPQQFETVKNQPHDVVASDLIPLKNFRRILVFHEEPDFSQ
ncbi:MAG: hypothetical protein Q8Q20_04455 [bacterium]|nr:hypothetical protein [bacterium]